jgi:hypothetical protein
MCYRRQHPSKLWMVWMAPSLDHNTKECMAWPVLEIAPLEVLVAMSIMAFIIVVSSWCYIDEILGALLLHLVDCSAEWAVCSRRRWVLKERVS